MDESQITSLRRKFYWLTEDAFSIFLLKLLLATATNGKEMPGSFYLRKIARSAKIEDMRQRGYRRTETKVEDHGHGQIIVSRDGSTSTIEPPKTVKDANWELIEIPASVMGTDANGETYGYEDILSTPDDLSLNNHPSAFHSNAIHAPEEARSERANDTIISTIDAEINYFARMSSISPIFSVLSGDQSLKKTALTAGITHQNLNAKRNVIMAQIAANVNACLENNGISVRVTKETVNLYVRERRKLMQSEYKSTSKKT